MVHRAESARRRSQSQPGNDVRKGRVLVKVSKDFTCHSHSLPRIWQHISSIHPPHQLACAANAKCVNVVWAFIHTTACILCHNTCQHTVSITPFKKLYVLKLLNRTPTLLVRRRDASGTGTVVKYCKEKTLNLLFYFTEFWCCLFPVIPSFMPFHFSLRNGRK